METKLTHKSVDAMSNQELHMMCKEDTDAYYQHLALNRKLLLHAHLYYNIDSPIVSDFEYDSMYSQIVALEDKHNWLISPHSITQRVGNNLSVPVTDTIRKNNNHYNVKHLMVYLLISTVPADKAVDTVKSIVALVDNDQRAIVDSEIFKVKKQGA